MWLYYCTFIVFFNIALIFQEAKSRKSLTVIEEQVFSDILKNISKVNRILEDLIRNYKQIQNLHEFSSLDQESDAEIDELFKSRLQTSTKRKEPQPSDDARLATEVYWSNEKYEDEKYVSSKEKENKNDTEIVVDTQSVIIENIKPDVPNHSMKNLNILRIKELPDFNVKNESNTHTVVSKNDFKTNHNEDKKTLFTKKLTTIEINLNLEARIEPYHQNSHERNKKKGLTYKKHRIIDKTTEVDNVSNFMDYFENEEKDETMEGQYKMMEVLNEIMKKVSEKTSAEEDLSIEKGKTEIIRSGYGDACTKLVVEKCHKACVAAMKTVCKSFSCANAFKESYKEAYKKECTNEFRGKDKIKKNRHESQNKESGDCNTKRQKMRRNSAEHTSEVEEAIDSNVAAVLTEMENKALRMLKKSQNLTGQDQLANRTILRDRYEKACKKISAGKCDKACKNAFQEACKTSECNVKFNNKVTAMCKKECNVVYQLSKKKKVKKSSSSSESSSSSDDSSSRSDTDSD